MNFKKQASFPFLEEFKIFPINEDTIFVYKDTIYGNSKELPPDILVHEEYHNNRQKKYGPEKWIKKYLNDDKFRLSEEISAYRVQIKSIKIKEFQEECLKECASNLSGPLYGEIINYKKAFNLLK